MKGYNHDSRQLALMELLRTKLNGIVLKSEIRPRTLRAFSLLQGDNAGTVFNYKDTAKILDGESLLRDGRIFVGNLLSFGIAKVPVATAATTNSQAVLAPGNMEVISYAHPDFFANSNVAVSSFGGQSSGTSSTTELNAIRMFFNGELEFKTDSNIRLEKFPMSRFSGIEQYGAFVPRGLKVVDLFNAWLLDGSKDNTATIKYLAGKYDGIAGDLTTHRNFGVSEIIGFEIVCDKTKLAQIQAALGM